MIDVACVIYQSDKGKTHYGMDYTIAEARQIAKANIHTYNMYPRTQYFKLSRPIMIVRLKGWKNDQSNK